MTETVTRSERQKYVTELISFLRMQLSKPNVRGRFFHPSKGLFIFEQLDLERLEKASLRFEEKIFRSTRTRSEYVEQIIKKMYEIQTISPNQGQTLNQDYWHLFDSLRIYLVPLKRRIQEEEDTATKKVLTGIFSTLSRPRCDDSSTVNREDMTVLKKIEMYLKLNRLVLFDTSTSGIASSLSVIDDDIKSSPEQVNVTVEKLKEMVRILERVCFSEYGGVPGAQVLKQEGEILEGCVKWIPSPPRRELKIEEIRTELSLGEAGAAARRSIKRERHNSDFEGVKKRKLDNRNGAIDPMTGQQSQMNPPQNTAQRLEEVLPQVAIRELSQLTAENPITVGPMKVEGGAVLMVFGAKIQRNVEERIGIQPTITLSIPVSMYPEVEPRILFPRESETNVFMKSVKATFLRQYQQVSSKSIHNIIVCWVICIKSELEALMVMKESSTSGEMRYGRSPMYSGQNGNVKAGVGKGQEISPQLPMNTNTHLNGKVLKSQQGVSIDRSMYDGNRISSLGMNGSRDVNMNQAYSRWDSGQSSEQSRKNIAGNSILGGVFK